MFYVNKQNRFKISSKKKELTELSHLGKIKMYRTILRSQNLINNHSVIFHSRCCLRILSTISHKSLAYSLNQADNLINVKKNQLMSSSIEFSTTESIQTDLILDDLTRNIKSSKNLNDLLDLIEPYQSTLNNDQLVSIFGKIKELAFEIKSNEYASLVEQMKLKTEVKKSIEKFRQTAESSDVFKQLLNQTNSLINNLDTICLIDLLEILNLLKYDPKSEIIVNNLNVLRSRLNNLNLNEIKKCLEIMHHYLHHQSATVQFFKFNQDLLRIANKMILNDKLNLNDIQSISRCYFIFLKPENSIIVGDELINYLTNHLLSNRIKFNFEESVLILEKIKQCFLYFNYNVVKTRIKTFQNTNQSITNIYKQIEFRIKQNQLFPNSIPELIDKCNSIIYTELIKDDDRSRNEKINFYLSKLHDFTNTLNFELVHFYDEKLFYLLTSHLIKNLDNNYDFIYRLMINYSFYETYDERLLKLFYDLLCKNDKFRIKLDISKIYMLLSELRLPFIDHNLFSEILFNHLKSTLDANLINSVRLFSRTILNDVNNEKLFLHFFESIDKLDSKSYEKFNIKIFKEITLAKAHLSISSDLDQKLKFKIERKLDQLIQNFTSFSKKPTIGTKFIRFDNRIQNTGYLSNLVYLNAFVIYDRSIGDLLPLNQYFNYFDKIDRIPIKKDQEL